VDVVKRTIIFMIALTRGTITMGKVRLLFKPDIPVSRRPVANTEARLWELRITAVL